MSTIQSCSNSSDPLASPDPQPVPDARSRDWLLVVDDDAPICELFERSLGGDGLEVVSSHSARSALTVLEERTADPLLVFADVVMPGMDGLTFVRKVRARRPRSKIVVISGNLTDVSWWPADLRDVTFLAKPFRLAQLIELVATAQREQRAIG